MSSTKKMPILHIKPYRDTGSQCNQFNYSATTVTSPTRRGCFAYLARESAFLLWRIPPGRSDFRMEPKKKKPFHSLCLERQVCIYGPNTFVEFFIPSQHLFLSHHEWVSHLNSIAHSARRCAHIKSIPKPGFDNGIEDS